MQLANTYTQNPIQKDTVIYSLKKRKSKVGTEDVVGF